MRDTFSADRHRFVTAAHQFLVQGLPLHHPSTKVALERFLSTARTCRVPTAEAEAVVLQALILISRRAGVVFPSLVDRYCETPGCRREPLHVFHELISELLRSKSIDDREVHRAIRTLEERYCDPALTEAAAASDAGLTPQQLSRRFKKSTGTTWSAYRRNLRMDRAAEMLLATSKSIKEIWAAIGYNDGSNFVHDFTGRFGHTPRDYRRGGVYLPGDSSDDLEEPDVARVAAETRRGTILIVDDHATGRDTIARYLRLEGWTVRTAGTGEQALVELGHRCHSAVLLDYHLPDMTGLTCLKEWRRRGGSSIPTAIFTADWNVEDEADEISVHGAIIVSKLCDLDEVGRLVASLAAGAI